MGKHSGHSKLSRPNYASLTILLLSLGWQSPSAATAKQSIVVAQTQDQILHPCRDHLQNNQFEQAFLTCQTARDTLQQLGDRPGEMRALSNMGSATTELGNYPKALELHQQSLTLAQQLQLPKQQAISLYNLATVYSYQSHTEKALQHFQQSLNLARDLQNPQLEINGLIGIGLVYQDQGDYANAIATQDQSLALARQLQNPALEARALGSLANLHDLSGDYPKAIALNHQAIAIFQALDDPRSEAQALNNLALIYSAQGNYDAAIERYQTYLNLARQLKLPQDEATALGNLADVYIQLGQSQTALELQQQHLEIAIALQSHSHHAAALTGIGLAQDGLGQYPQAIASHEQALALHKQHLNPLGQARSLNNLGTLYSSLGQYVTALKLHQQQLALLQPLQSPTEEAKAVQNLGTIYHDLGQLEKAAEFYREALAIFEALGEQPGEADVLGNLGAIAIQQGQWNQAQDWLQQQLAIAQTIGNPLTEATVFGNLGRVYEGLAQSSAARDAYQQQLTLAENQQDRAQAATALTNLGAMAHDQGQYDEAQAFHRQGLNLNQELGNRLRQAKNLSNIATTAFRQGDLETAVEIQAQAIEQLETVRDRNLQDASKISLLELYRRNYAQHQQLLVAVGQPLRALEISERGRARAFVELLSDRTATQSTTKLPTEPPNLTDLKRIAKTQQATLVEYSIINTGISNPSLYTWVIPPTGQISFHQTVLDKPIQQLVKHSRRSLGNQGRSFSFVPPENLPVVEQTRRQNQHLQDLHQLLIAPIADQLPQDPNQTVIFIPQDELFLVPFPALQDTQGNYLIEQYSILTAPSIQALDLTHQQSQRLGSPNPHDLKPNDILIVGNPTMPSIYSPGLDADTPLSPLVGAEDEARQIAQLLGTTALIKDAATERAVKRRSEQAKLIHLATHGLLDYGNPQLTGVDDLPGAIALAPSNQEDGLLTTAELLQLDLKADLVVLSACDTGRGELTADGVIGLSRSLMTAGVSSVMVSLWQVPDDSTAMLMTEFYKQWQSSGNKADALRQAMLNTMEQYSAPIHWSAFTLMGESK